MPCFSDIVNPSVAPAIQNYRFVFRAAEFCSAAVVYPELLFAEWLRLMTHYLSDGFISIPQTNRRQYNAGAISFFIRPILPLQVARAISLEYYCVRANAKAQTGEGAQAGKKD